MRGGKNAKSTKLKLLQGTARKDRMRNEPEAQEGEPTRPAYLNKVAREEWDRIVPQVLAMKTLTIVDGPMLAGYCVMHALAVRLAGEIDKLVSLAVIKVTVDGAGTEHQEEKEHPHVAALGNTLNKCRLFLGEFGLSPATRSRINLKLQEPKNKLERFLGKA